MWYKLEQSAEEIDKREMSEEESDPPCKQLSHNWSNNKKPAEAEPTNYPFTVEIQLPGVSRIFFSFWM